MEENNLIKCIQKYNSLSIIGMDKNVGKTTVLNYIINNIQGSKAPLGLTSIGRDGEKTDRVTNTKKPRIYIGRGTFVATAKQCLYSGDITREIIETTGINTPMGEVIIARALSDGYVELGGPSLTSHMTEICSRLKQLGSSLVIVDGALSRKTLASPSVTEAAILSTGAALSRDMDEVLEKTKHTLDLLSIQAESDSRILEICSKLPPSCRVNMINKDYSVNTLNCITSLDASRDIVDNLHENIDYIFIRGIISNSLLEGIVKSTDKYKKTVFLAEDGTKLFLSKDTLLRFRKGGGIIRVISPINTVCLTCNPISPYGYEFNKDIFLKRLNEEIKLPCFDVCN